LPSVVIEPIFSVVVLAKNTKRLITAPLFKCTNRRVADLSINVVECVIDDFQAPALYVGVIEPTNATEERRAQTRSHGVERNQDAREPVAAARRVCKK
jgi:hypothetical protein